MIHQKEFLRIKKDGIEFDCQHWENLISNELTKCKTSGQLELITILIKTGIENVYERFEEKNK